MHESGCPGAAKEATGDEAGALDDYLAADRIHGKCGASLASLSWIRSTALDGDIRNGMLAVQNAERAFTFKGAPTRRRAEILAAAYAEAGDYQQALDVLQKEMEDADSSRLMTLLLLTDTYRRREPIRVQSWKPMRREDPVVFPGRFQGRFATCLARDDCSSPGHTSGRLNQTRQSVAGKTRRFYRHSLYGLCGRC